MTCYFRHLSSLFEQAGIQVTEENKRDLDQIIHNIVGVQYKDCPATWKEVKRRMAEDKEEFVSVLKQAWRKRQSSQHITDP